MSKLALRNWTVIGIDPGWIPTMVVLQYRGDEIKVYDPEHLRTFNTREKHGLPSPARIRQVFEYFDPQLVVIEKVWVRPKQGVSSSAKLIYGAALTEGIALGLNLNVLAVYPITWKKYFGLVRSEKSASIKYAQTWDPDKSAWFVRQKDHNRADAFLLGHFGVKYLDKVYERNVRRLGAAIDHNPAVSGVK